MRSLILPINIFCFILSPSPPPKKNLNNIKNMYIYIFFFSEIEPIITPPFWDTHIDTIAHIQNPGNYTPWNKLS